MRNSNDWDNGWLTHLISLLRGKKKKYKNIKHRTAKGKSGLLWQQEQNLI